MSCRPRLQAFRNRDHSSGAGCLSDLLYSWRKKNDFSQSEAALRLQVSPRTLQEWEQGRAQPTHLALQAIKARMDL